MTVKNDFTSRVTTAPIYNTIESQLLSSDKSSEGQQTNPDWQKWFQQVHNNVAATNYYGNPSVCLNSDFYWNTGIANPVTQAAGNGAYFSEKWQVEGASVANYTLTRTAFAGDSSDQTGSDVYVHVAVSSWSGGSFYFYQRQLGEAFLRRYQNRNIYMSTKLNNNSSDILAMKFVVAYYDGSGGIEEYSKGVIHFSEGTNYTSSLIKTPSIAPRSASAGAYVDFRFEFSALTNNTADFDLIYIKAEMADVPTALYVDHALEKTRIANS